jgi:hypothetical protein
MPNFQGVWSLSEQYQNAGIWPSPPVYALFHGQGTTSIDRVDINTTGNATDFGDFANDGADKVGLSSSTRALFSGGSVTNVVEFITFSAGGTATDFGDMTIARQRLGTCSSATRGVFAGGETASTRTNVMDYVTIASAGNATDFGDLLQGVRYNTGNCASPTRGLFHGGQNTSNALINVIQYITIASTGDSTDFGDISVNGNLGAGHSCSNATRGILSGGWDSGSTATNFLSFVTLASTGNTTDFGDLPASISGLASAASPTRALFAGGDDPYARNVVSYVTIASTGNTTDFGDLTRTMDDGVAGCSNGHGGLS